MTRMYPEDFRPEEIIEIEKKQIENNPYNRITKLEAEIALLKSNQAKIATATKVEIQSEVIK